jgi:hypothetical protein
MLSGGILALEITDDLQTTSIERFSVIAGEVVAVE